MGWMPTTTAGAANSHLVFRTAGQRIALQLITRYQRRGSGRGRCVFTPTCSEYSRLAIARFGVARGAGMTLRRLTQCHGGNAGVTDYPD